MRFALLLLPVLLLGCAAPADTPSPVDGAVSETTARLGASEGGQMVLDAVNAHGGLDAWYSAPTSSYAWEYSNAGSQTRFKTHMVVDNGSRLAYHDLLELGKPDSV
ncbi:MAG: hypothetical protein ACI9W4_002704, partial [Rhodothermales bacterium]